MTAEVEADVGRLETVDVLMVSRGLPLLTSTQYEFPSLMPLQSSLTDGFCDYELALGHEEHNIAKNREGCLTQSTNSLCDMPQKSSRYSQFSNLEMGTT